MRMTGGIGGHGGLRDRRLQLNVGLTCASARDATRLTVCKLVVLDRRKLPGTRFGLRMQSAGLQMELGARARDI